MKSVIFGNRTMEVVKDELALTEIRRRMTRELLNRRGEEIMDHRGDKAS